MDIPFPILFLILMSLTKAILKMNMVAVLIIIKQRIYSQGVTNEDNIRQSVYTNLF